MPLGILADRAIDAVYHYAPPHYLPFIAQARSLLSKPELRALGFSDRHFRSTSKAADEERGFGGYVHMTLEEFPQILAAKLASGFPHFETAVPGAVVEAVTFHLCRFNVAKSRNLRRNGKAGPAEVPMNGRYYLGKELPIACTDRERRDLFDANYGTNMIEVLVPNKLTLPDGTKLTFYREEDLVLAKRILGSMSVPWGTSLSPRRYEAKASYVAKVEAFVNMVLSRSSWKGDGLEFDRI